MAEKNSASVEGEKIDPGAEGGIDPGAEGDEGGKATLPGFDETGPPDYDVEMKRLLCKRLESNIRHSELLCDRLEADNGESPHERQQRVRLWFLVTRVAGVVPVIALLVLFGVMVISPDNFFKGTSSAVLISASFLSMVVIYGLLIKGMFQNIQKDDESDISSALKEILEAVRSPGGKE